jgi:hypothetical protein
MAGGTIYNIANITDVTSKYARTKPHYYLIAVILLIFFIVYSQRIFGITRPDYSVFMTVCVIILISFIIIMTFLYVLEIRDPEGYIESFSNVFNSSGGRTFLAIILLVLFIIFVYETPTYGNNNPNETLNILTFGHNTYISNRTYGIILIVIFGTFTAYVATTMTNEDRD